MNDDKSYDRELGITRKEVGTREVPENRSKTSNFACLEDRYYSGSSGSSHSDEIESCLRTGK
jgi:hypothetical protein